MSEPTSAFLTKLASMEDINAFPLDPSQLPVLEGIPSAYEMATNAVKNPAPSMADINARWGQVFSSKNQAPWYKNGDTLSGYAGLAAALTGLAGFKDQKNLLKTQTAGLKQNIAFAKEEQDRRNKSISSFNNFRPASVSAFAPKI